MMNLKRWVMLIFGVFFPLFLEINSMEGIEGLRGTKRGIEEEEALPSLKKIRYEKLYEFKDMGDTELIKQFKETPLFEKKIAIYDYFKRNKPTLIETNIIPLMKDSNQMNQNLAPELHLRLARVYETGDGVEEDLEHANLLYKLLFNNHYMVIDPITGKNTLFRLQNYVKNKLEEINEQLIEESIDILKQAPSSDSLKAYNQLMEINPDLINELDSNELVRLGEDIMESGENPEEFKAAKVLFLKAIDTNKPGDSHLAKYYLAHFYDDPKGEKEAVAQEFIDNFDVYGKKDLESALKLYKDALESEGFWEMVYGRGFPRLAKNRIKEISKELEIQVSEDYFKELEAKEDKYEQIAVKEEEEEGAKWLSKGR